MNDTICAVSTAVNNGAISIIRVSGSEAVSIVNLIFKGKDLEKQISHTIHYGHIMDHNEIIDEVMVSVLLAPRTYTREDVVEINCHGGISSTTKILEILLNNNCRLAEPGEFSKRAFLNGRIDLIKAEGVMELINAKTEQARKLAISQISGSVSNKINQLRKIILGLISNIKVNIDYPEYDDIRILTIADIKAEFNIIKEYLTKILKDSESGKIIENGIKTAIIGQPNVGKSSLLNALLEEEKAIVTNIPGTTRDIVEGIININGLVLNILDTAGIRETEDEVEKIGVTKSFKMIKEADLVLFMLNNNQPLDEIDLQILKKLEEKPHLIIVNKIDLPQKLELEQTKNLIYISLLENDGIEKLKTRIEEMYNINNIVIEDLTYLSNAKNISLIKKALEIIPSIETGIENDIPIDMIEIDLEQIWNILGEIIGETSDDQLIDNLFQQFCLGK